MPNETKQKPRNVTVQFARVPDIPLPPDPTPAELASQYRVRVMTREIILCDLLRTLAADPGLRNQPRYEALLQRFLAYQTGIA